jgi:hypothetical protein
MCVRTRRGAHHPNEGVPRDLLVQHRRLLRHLKHADVVPRDYVRFLDFAAEHVLLQRIGGGYRFIHALLLDYFADLWAEESEGTEPDQAVLAEQVSQ